MNKLKQKRNSKINFDRGSVRRPNAMNLCLWRLLLSHHENIVKCICRNAKENGLARTNQ